MAREFETTKQRSALRQIEAAIAHFHKGEFDSAITLAAAGEGQLPETMKDYMFRLMRRLAPRDDFNLIVNWLKHPGGPDAITIIEFEAILVISRAIHKFVAAYEATTQAFVDFEQWAVENGHMPRFLSQKSK